ncbi:hypothetical protein NUACC26_085340 [Scytonema sp. NUACC26]
MGKGFCDYFISAIRGVLKFDTIYIMVARDFGKVIKKVKINRTLWLFRIIDIGVEVLKSPQTLSGENVLPGFVLNMQQIWE